MVGQSWFLILFVHVMDDCVLPVYQSVKLLIEPGKNHDGYWQATDILKQLEEKAIPGFDEMHPGARGIFIFDNSTNHGAYAADALLAIASKMNLNSGGNQVVKFH